MLLVGDGGMDGALRHDSRESEQIMGVDLPRVSAT